LVADCDDSADFAQNFSDVSFGTACDVKPAGNNWPQYEAAFPEGVSGPLEARNAAKGVATVAGGAS
jgi:hypothetical protein